VYQNGYLKLLTRFLWENRKKEFSGLWNENSLFKSKHLHFKETRTRLDVTTKMLWQNTI
jgi:hypothetical protein